MKIAIIGTRGIPNHYGGFEQCAEYLAVGLVENGFDVTVYNSHNHPYAKSSWKGVNIVHKYDPENKLGTTGQFIYDLNCIWHSRKQKFDIILQLGYTSSTVWWWLMPKKTIVTTNMDGLEWKRTKYSKTVKRFLRYAEKLGAQHSDHLISDSLGIQNHLRDAYDKASTFIPYGAHPFLKSDAEILKNYGVSPNRYDMLVARLEPENSIEIILDGVVKANTRRTFLVIGKYMTKYGSYLKHKYRDLPNIVFVGAVYNMDTLNNLRYYSNLYFHGHTVGGTNPSLLEAMASNSLICAHQNQFNQYILDKDGLYFKTENEVAFHLRNISGYEATHKKMIVNNRQKIDAVYSWQKIINEYIFHFEEISLKHH